MISLDNKDEIYDELYRNVIAPCVKLINDGNNEAAYEKYRAMVKDLEKTYLS